MYSYIYLASKSPRRQQLLKQVDIPFKLLEQNADEQQLNNETPNDFVIRIAKDKALNGYQQLKQNQHETAPVLGADTIIVAEKNNEKLIIGKPSDKNNAVNILNLLSDNTHHVLTAICITDGNQIFSAISTSKVSFRELSINEINEYWNSGEPRDKAGAYAIQGRAAKFISHISGSYSGIMGLPLYEVSKLLQNFDTSY